MTKEKEFVERYSPIDDIRSSHAELQRSNDYSNEVLYPLNKLEALGLYWMDEESNPLRSERSQAVCRQITKRLSFECAYRTGRIQTLIDFYGADHE